VSESKKKAAEELLNKVDVIAKTVAKIDTEYWEALQAAKREIVQEFLKQVQEILDEIKAERAEIEKMRKMLYWHRVSTERSARRSYGGGQSWSRRRRKE